MMTSIKKDLYTQSPNSRQDANIFALQLDPQAFKEFIDDPR